MAKINVTLTHREKPCAVQLDNYGMVSLKNGIAVIAIEKKDLTALQKQGKRDTKFTVEEVTPPTTTEPAAETVDASKTEPAKAAEPPAKTNGGK